MRWRATGCSSRASRSSTRARGTPARSIAIQAVLASVLALSGTFDQILDYFMVPTMVFVA